MYYLDTGGTGETRFRNAVIVALALHAVLVLGISFNARDVQDYAPQIEVTLATLPNQPAPEDARLIAQSSQIGAGDEAHREQQTSRNNQPSDSLSPEQARMQAPRPRAELQRDVVSTTALSQTLVNDDKASPERPDNQVQGMSEEVERLTREIASLEAELDESERLYADQSRVRRLTAATAKQSVDAAYLLDWRRRLEAVGNEYYPQASVRYGLYGDLRLLVVIRYDGSLEDIRVLSSSGYAVLDEAAIKIVRMAAPYAPFPKELRATTDKLEIVRTWHFQENQLSSP